MSKSGYRPIYLAAFFVSLGCLLSSYYLGENNRLALLWVGLPLLAFVAAIQSRWRGIMHVYLFTTAFFALAGVVRAHNEWLLFGAVLGSLAVWHLVDADARVGSAETLPKRPNFVTLATVGILSLLAFGLVPLITLTLDLPWILLIILALVISLIIASRSVRKMKSKPRKATES